MALRPSRPPVASRKNADLRAIRLFLISTMPRRSDLPPEKRSNHHRCSTPRIRSNSHIGTTTGGKSRVQLPDLSHANSHIAFLRTCETIYDWPALGSLLAAKKIRRQK